MARNHKWLRKWKRQEKKAEKNWQPYTERNKALVEMGFATYADYLVSPLWKGIREKRLADHPDCSCCNSTANVVHHDTYYKKLLLGDEESVKRDLFPLCHSCHRLVEFDGERKRSWGEAIRQFRRMLYRFKHGMSKAQMIREKVAKRRESENAK